MTPVFMVVYKGTMHLPPAQEHKSVHEDCATGHVHFVLSVRGRGDGHRLEIGQGACVPRVAFYV